MRPVVRPDDRSRIASSCDPRHRDEASGRGTLSKTPGRSILNLARRPEDADAEIFSQPPQIGAGVEYFTADIQVTTAREPTILDRPSFAARGVR